MLACAALACGGPAPRSQQSIHDDGVPANSLSDKRLGREDEKSADDTKKKEETRPDKADKPDPTQPLLTPIAGASGDEPRSNGGARGAGARPGKVSKAECAQLFDKYVDLAIGADARLEGLPPELVQQAKAQARSKDGGDPCDKQVVARAKYDCAMAATTPAAWQRCMK